MMFAAKNKQLVSADLNKNQLIADCLLFYDIHPTL